MFQMLVNDDELPRHTQPLQSRIALTFHRVQKEGEGEGGDYVNCLAGLRSTRCWREHQEKITKV